MGTATACGLASQWLCHLAGRSFLMINVPYLQLDSRMYILIWSINENWPEVALYPQKLALTSPTSGDISVGVVRSRTHATEFSFLVISSLYNNYFLKLEKKHLCHGNLCF
jgi:hypothetical protein